MERLKRAEAMLKSQRMRFLCTTLILLSAALLGAAAFFLFQKSQIACSSDNAHPAIVSGTPEAAARDKATPLFEKLFRTDMKGVRTYLDQPKSGGSNDYWFIVFEPSRGKTWAGCTIPDPNAAWMAQVRKSDLKVVNAGGAH